ncbi:MAG: hypothetical protein RL701_4755 [Pseudomonadota bacterium]|jgi:hypothetical protein
MIATYLIAHRIVWLVAQVLYLYAPLLLSAALSGFVMKLDWFRWLKYPIDAHLTLRGRRVFGDSKTWRGVAVAIVGCSVGAAVQKYAIGSAAGSLALCDYSQLHVLSFGSAMGFSAMLGELPNSFTKRQLNIAPGKTAHGGRAVIFYVWDQIDLLTFSWPALSCWIDPTLPLVLTSVGITLLLHPLVSLIGYVTGARRSAR